MSIAADVTREEWDWYVDKIVPQIDKQLAEVADLETGVSKAQQDATLGFTNQRGRDALTMSRYGISRTADQQSAYDRQMALGQTGAQANAANTQRLGNVDRRTQQLGNLLATVQGLSTSAQEGLGQYSNLQNQREANNAALAAQRTASRNQMIGQMGNAAMMAYAIFSSRDYKENIEMYPVDQALDRINQMEVVEFDYKPEMEAPDQRFIGGIAEDVPDEFATPDRKALNAYNLIGSLVGAVQALTARVKELEYVQN